MDHRHLHIISFDVPLPADYGGVIDVYYKVKALSEAGIKVHLHCFQYGRPERAELERSCESVHYYQRRTNKHLLLNSLPYVVVSRRSDECLERLLSDDHPILFEGLHSCYHLGDHRLAGRKRLVRAHNVEHEYYRALSEVERSTFRRSYFRAESRKLQKFELVLHEADEVLAISDKDRSYFQQVYGKGVHIPAFHPCNRVDPPPGLGTNVVYHGSLGVPENERAAMFLVQQVFNEPGCELLIAGSGASPLLVREVAKRPHIRLDTKASAAQITHYVEEAQVNVLPTFQNTGIKLKLLLSLFRGRHVVCNAPMVEGTGLEALVHVCDGAEAMRKKVMELMGQPISAGTRQARVSLLESTYSVSANAQRIIALLD